MATVEDNRKVEGHHTVRGPSQADKEATVEAKDRDIQVLLANKQIVKETDMSTLREETTPVPTALEKLELTNNPADHKKLSTADASRGCVDANKYKNRKLSLKLEKIKLSKRTPMQRKSLASSRRYLECKKHKIRESHLRVKRMVSIAESLEEYPKDSKLKTDLHKHAKLHTTMDAQPQDIGVFCGTSKKRNIDLSAGHDSNNKRLKPHLQDGKSGDTETTDVTHEAFKMYPKVVYKISETDSRTSQFNNRAINTLIEGINKAFGEYSKTVIVFNDGPAVISKKYQPINNAPEAINSASTVTNHASTVTNHASTITNHALTVTNHASTVTNHASTVTNHASTVTNHASSVTNHASTITNHASTVTNYASTLTNLASPVTNHVSTVTNHAPTATCPGTSTQTSRASNVLIGAQAKNGDQGTSSSTQEASIMVPEVINKASQTHNKAFEINEGSTEMMKKALKVINKTSEVSNKAPEMDKENGQRKEDGGKLVKTKGEMFQGTMYPIAIFPEEIWEMILNQVSSLDRLATCRTNTQLDTAFGECKNEWLFDQVLPFLLKHFTEPAHMLKCRQVCKNWRRTVNSFLESEHPCRRVYQKNHPLEQLFCRMPSTYSNLGRCGLQYIRFTPKCIDKFSSCPDPTEPLVGRAVSFVMYPYTFHEAEPEFCLHARTFLGLQNRNIWHFKFAFFIDVVSAKSWYQTLWEWLKLLPNLRTLEMYNMPTRRDNPIAQEILAKLIAVNPLPVPPRLHSLHMQNVPTVIQQHMVQLSKQLKSLSIQVSHVDDLPYVFHGGSNLLANLVEICIIVSNDDTDTLRRLHTMNTLTGPKCCQKLNLNFLLDREVSWLELLELLVQYPQLSQVRIKLFPESFHVGDCRGCSLVVLRVEYLEILASTQDLICFSKLLHRFPNLKFLHLIHNLSPVCRLDTKHWLHNLEESPLWDTLNELELLTFDCAYFRERRKNFCSRERVRYYREQMKTYDKKSTSWRP